MRFVASVFLLFSTACGIGALELRGAPTTPFDVVIVPGCPSEDDGRPSRCQLARAIWATILYERGWAQRFVTSGSDVYTPFVEAEAMAQVMAVLGVPADRIYLERDALHTDENMFFSMQIAKRLDARTVAVASTRGHAGFGCRMLIDWGQPCRSITVDLPAVIARHDRMPAALFDSLRAPRSATWAPLVERERRRFSMTKKRRPPSWLLYPTLALQHAAGETWIPIALEPIPLLTWADRLAAEMAHGSDVPATR